MEPKPREPQELPKKAEVRLSVDVAELEAIKAATKVDASATAMMAAARVGLEYLKKVGLSNPISAEGAVHE